MDMVQRHQIAASKPHARGGGRIRVFVVATLAVGLLAACTATPTPSPLVEPSALPSASVPAVSSSPAALMTDHLGRIAISHPATWIFTSGPPAVAGGSVPLFYLSNIVLDVRPCPTPNPTTHVFDGCAPPVTQLIEDGVLVTVSPNLGLAALVPPVVTVESASDGCLAIDGAQEVFAVVGGVVVTGCLRGPDVSASTAELQEVIASIAGAF